MQYCLELLHWVQMLILPARTSTWHEQAPLTASVYLETLTIASEDGRVYGPTVQSFQALTHSTLSYLFALLPPLFGSGSVLPLVFCGSSQSAARLGTDWKTTRGEDMATLLHRKSLNPASNNRGSQARLQGQHFPGFLAQTTQVWVFSWITIF